MLPFAKQIKYHFIIIIALLNVIVAFTSAFPLIGEANSGIIRMIIMLAYFAYYLPKLKIDATTKFIIIYLLYLLILVPMSSNIQATFFNYLRHGIALLMFPIALNYFKDLKNIRTLGYLTVISLVLLFSHFIYAQVFQTGEVLYRGYIFTGGGQAQQTYLIAYFLLLVPLFFLFDVDKRIKRLLIIIYPLSLVPLIMIARRGSIFGFLIGLFIYLLFTYRKSRGITILTVLAFIIILLVSLFGDSFYALFDSRMVDIVELERMGRYNEYFWAIDLIRERGITQALFGAELFNFQSITGGTRTLHSDFASILIGSGFIGILLYLMIFFSLLKNFSKNIKNTKSKKLRKELNAIFWSLIICNVIISLSGQYYLISSLTIIFIIFGSILGISNSISSYDNNISGGFDINVHNDSSS